MIESAFNGDIYLAEEVRKLIKKYNIKTFVETGTWKGHTTELVSELVHKAFTIEIDEEYWKESNYLSTIKNVVTCFGSSDIILDELFTDDKVESPVLFYLDAHWKDSWPLLDELKVIAKHKLSDCVIIIHDFYNPINEELGCDSYKGQRLDWDYVKDYIYNIYKENFSYYYNKEATGERRGAIIIVPK